MAPADLSIQILDKIITMIILVICLGGFAVVIRKGNEDTKTSVEKEVSKFKTAVEKEISEVEVRHDTRFVDHEKWMEELKTEKLDTEIHRLGCENTQLQLKVHISNELLAIRSEVKEFGDSVHSAIRDLEKEIKNGGGEKEGNKELPFV